VAANLSDSIMVALDEAISNLDSAFGTALNESVSGALMVPVDQMKQSTQEVSGSVAAVRQIAEDVKISADEMRYISADLKESTEGLRTSNEELKATVKTSVDNALLAIRRENREIADHLEYIRTSVETIHKPDPNEESLKLEQEQLKEQREQEKEEARIAREEENRKQIEELFKQADDFVHKENVKVYRNVQAVVVDELRSQTEGLTKHNRELYSKLKATNVAVVVSIIFGAINLIFMILFIFGIIG